MLLKKLALDINIATDVLATDVFATYTLPTGISICLDYICMQLFLSTLADSDSETTDLLERRKK